MRDLLVAGLASATSEASLTSPYFAPDRKVLGAMGHAAERGVKVTLMLAGRTDHPILRRAARALLPRLHRIRSPIYEYTQSMLHAKATVFDDVWAVVGTSNLDRQSFEHSYEVNLVIEGGPIPGELSDMFEQDLQHATRVDTTALEARGAIERLVDRLAALLLASASEWSGVRLSRQHDDCSEPPFCAAEALGRRGRASGAHSLIAAAGRAVLAVPQAVDQGAHRQVIGGAPGARAGVHLHLQERGARLHPDAVEREHGEARRKAAHARRAAEAAVQAVQHRRHRQPLVEVAEQDQRAAVVAAQRVEQAAHLDLPLARAQAEVGGDDADRACRAIARSTSSAPRRSRPGTLRSIWRTRTQRVAGQQAVAVAAAMVLQHRPRHRLVAHRLRQVGDLIDAVVDVVARVDLLQGDHVGLQLAQHVRDPVRVMATVETDAAVNVVRREGELGHAGSPGEEICAGRLFLGSRF